MWACYCVNYKTLCCLHLEATTCMSNNSSCLGLGWLLKAKYVGPPVVPPVLQEITLFVWFQLLPTSLI